MQDHLNKSLVGGVVHQPVQPAVSHRSLTADH
jgi:hypothetical protein